MSKECTEKRAWTVVYGLSFPAGQQVTCALGYALKADSSVHRRHARSLKEVPRPTRAIASMHNPSRLHLAAFMTCAPFSLTLHVFN